MYINPNDLAEILNKHVRDDRESIDPYDPSRTELLWDLSWEIANYLRDADPFFNRQQFLETTDIIMYKKAGPVTVATIKES